MSVVPELYDNWFTYAMLAQCVLFAVGCIGAAIDPGELD